MVVGHPRNSRHNTSRIPSTLIGCDSHPALGQHPAGDQHWAAEFCQHRVYSLKLPYCSILADSVLNLANPFINIGGIAVETKGIQKG